MSYCLVCQKTPKRTSYKFCSNHCQGKYYYLKFIEIWKKESAKGNNIITSIKISNHIRKYLIEKNNHSCSLCGWNKKHPITGVVPLEIDHIDGNAQNNLEENLRVFCANCHSLTPNFRNLNKGKGRVGRLKFVFNKSMDID